MQLTEPADRLVVDESPSAPGPDLRMLVIDSPELAEMAVAAGAEVHGFCDAADQHAALPAGVMRLSPADPLPELDLAWLRLPRDLDALDQLAAWVAPTGATLVGAARVKHMTPTMNGVLARHFGQVRASRGRDKSRALVATGGRAGGNRPWPRWGEVEVPGESLRVAHHGATFAAGRLDRATKMLLAEFGRWQPHTPRPRILDWGSGAGIISATLARAHPQASVRAVDLSWAGWAATSATVAANHLVVDTHWEDGNRLLSTGEEFDLIVSNPPFHSGATKDSTATITMIDAAARALSPGGELWLTYNSHLPWLQHLRRHGRTEVLAQDRGYTVARLLR